jgi:hypothetical protein
MDWWSPQAIVTFGSLSSARKSFSKHLVRLTKAFRVVWGQLFDTPNGLPPSLGQTAIVEYSRQRDFAVIKVEPTPKAEIKLSCDPNNPRKASGMALGIAHHPGGDFLHWSHNCHSTPWVDANHREDDWLGTTAIEHDCSTDGGSSGAPIFMLSPDGNVELVGIHVVGGICNKGRVPGLSAADSSTWKCKQENGLPDGSETNIVNGGLLFDEQEVCGTIADIMKNGFPSIPNDATTTTLPIDCSVSPKP